MCGCTLVQLVHLRFCKSKESTAISQWKVQNIYHLHKHEADRKCNLYKLFNTHCTLILLVINIYVSHSQEIIANEDRLCNKVCSLVYMRF